MQFHPDYHMHARGSPVDLWAARRIANKLARDHPGGLLVSRFDVVMALRVWGWFVEQIAERPEPREQTRRSLDQVAGHAAKLADLLGDRENEAVRNALQERGGLSLLFGLPARLDNVAAVASAIVQPRQARGEAWDTPLRREAVCHAVLIYRWATGLLEVGWDADGDMGGPLVDFVQGALSCVMVIFKHQPEGGIREDIRRALAQIAADPAACLYYLPDHLDRAG